MTDVISLELAFKAIDSNSDINLQTLLVGVAGFEPTASSTPCWRATRLRYTPILCEIFLEISKDSTRLFKKKNESEKGFHSRFFSKKLRCKCIKILKK